MNTMQKNIKEFIHRLHAANRERITSPEVSKTSQSASIRCSKRPIKKRFGSPPGPIHTIQKKGGRERKRER